MKIDRISSRRRTMAHLFSMAMSVPILGGFGKILEPTPFDARDYFSSRSRAQLRRLGLSEELAERVAQFQDDLLTRSFADFGDLRAWLLDKIDAEYRLQRLAVHQRCIVSHTEVALLVSNFPRGLAES